jgi:hypothetical protein
MNSLADVLRHRPQPTSRTCPTQPQQLPMSQPEQACSLLDELDQRQNEVLRQLEDLDRRVESLLHECLTSRQTDHDSDF